MPPVKLQPRQRNPCFNNEAASLFGERFSLLLIKKKMFRFMSAKHRMDINEPLTKRKIIKKAAHSMSGLLFDQ